jgi:AraC-like DNA-binding protein
MRSCGRGIRLSAIERFSTSLVPLQRRHLFWRELVAETFPGMTANAPEGISAELARWSLGRIGLARARSDRARVSRVASIDHAHNLVFHLQRRGQLTMICGDEAVTAGVGDIIIADDSRPYAIDISERNDCLILQVPAAMIGAELSPAGFHGQLLSGRDPNVAFLKHMLEGLWTEREMFDEIEESIDGVVASAARIACNRRARPSQQDITPQSPVKYALNNLGDPALSTATISQATGLGARAVQKAFARYTALTPTAFIAERRLGQAADLLAHDRSQSITDIAFEVGFSDSAFFSRCFRRRFGVPPSQWREKITAN